MIPPASQPDAATDHSALMDRLYRVQRHIYDLTRPFFLFGRNRVLDEIDLQPGQTLIEIGCGTARNLIRLARGPARHPDIRLIGIDASAAMLATARAKVARRSLTPRILLLHGYAENLPRLLADAGFDQPSDAVLFSYSLSMMTGWSDALDAALAAVRPGGRIHIVDFCDQAAWPALLRRPFTWYLSLFHVRCRPELLDRLHELERTGDASLRFTPFLGRYAFRAVLTKRDNSRPSESA